MKIGTFLSFTEKEDIQIQTAVGRLLFKVTVPDAFSTTALNDIKIRLRAFGAKGSRPVIDTRTPLQALFEIAASKEGFYRTSHNVDDSQTTFEGMVEISSEGALALNSDQYLSLDVTAPNGIVKMELWAVSGPVPSTTFLRYTPLTVQETIKDVPLSGIDSIVFAPANIETLKFQYPDMSADYEKEELESIGCCINDLVSVDMTTHTTQCGFIKYITMSTRGASRATISPAGGATPFTVYLISTEKL